MRKKKKNQKFLVHFFSIRILVCSCANAFSVHHKQKSTTDKYINTVIENKKKITQRIMEFCILCHILFLRLIHFFFFFVWAEQKIFGNASIQNNSKNNLYKYLLSSFDGMFALLDDWLFYITCVRLFFFFFHHFIFIQYIITCRCSDYNSSWYIFFHGVFYFAFRSLLFFFLFTLTLLVCVAFAHIIFIALCVYLLTYDLTELWIYAVYEFQCVGI